MVHSKGVHKPVGRQRRRAGRTYLPRPFLKDALLDIYLQSPVRSISKLHRTRKNRDGDILPFLMALPIVLVEKHFIAKFDTEITGQNLMSGRTIIIL